MSGSNNDPSVSGKQSYSAGLFLGEPTPPQFFHSPPRPQPILCAEWRLAGRWRFQSHGQGRAPHNDGNVARRGEVGEQK